MTMTGACMAVGGNRDEEGKERGRTATTTRKQDLLIEICLL